VELMQQKILESRGQHLSDLGACIAGGADLPLHRTPLKKDFTDEELLEVFQEFDIFCMGSVDHRLMPNVFKQLGFHIDPQLLCGMLVSYDQSSDIQDGESDFKELKLMVHDDRLIGQWKENGPELSMQRQKSADLGKGLAESLLPAHVKVRVDSRS